MRRTVGLKHEAGDELQLDWLELSETPWGAKAYVLVGALSHPSRLRGVFCDRQHGCRRAVGRRSRAGGRLVLVHSEPGLNAGS